MPQWDSIAVVVLLLLVAYQQFRIYRIQWKSRQRDELFQIVTENAADMIALVDLKGRRLYNSPAYKRILGYTPAELGETSSFEQIHAEDRFKVLEAAREARSTGLGKRLEYRIRHKDGTWRTLESIASVIRDKDGDVCKLVIVNRDVTERKRSEEQLERNSFHDALTGLPNRRLFLDRLQHWFERAQRCSDLRYAVLFADLDGFKQFNDTMGPGQGDRIIVEIGNRLDSCLREEDTLSRSQDKLPTQNAVLSRMGGDEFTILLESVVDPGDAMRVANRILSAVAHPFIVEGREVRASISVGIALSASSHVRAEDILQEADVAMRRAKALGGSRCEIFDEAMHHRAANQLKLESELQEAVQKHQFRIYYQPIVQLETKQIVGFEALLRWQHPQQGLISPYKFIAAAENAGLMVSTGQWVILEACKQLRSWTAQFPGIQSLSLSVNISARQLADVHFAVDLERTIRETGIDSSNLYLELTETVAASDPQLTATVLSKLRQLRVGVILDDFGTGHSSLMGLRQLTLHALKIDRSLISAMHLDRNDCDTLELMILLAHKLKLTVIAEGIEEAKQLDHLRGLGCELGQGFLFSPPLDAKGAEQLLRQPALISQAKMAGAY